MSSTQSVSTPQPSWELERSIVSQGGQWIIGVDEVGRGCLAGPVMLGAVAFRAQRIGDDIPRGLKDSKLLTERKREALVEPVKQWADCWAVGQASNTEIDEQGISHCLGLAALRAIEDVERNLIEQFGHDFEAIRIESGGIPRILEPKKLPRIAVILDGPHDYISPVIGTFDAPIIPIVPRVYTAVKADQKCASVAGASVVAKVTRDAYMDELSVVHPQWEVYGWKNNKGYGSAAHRQAIATHGPTEYHRVSWNLV